MAVDFTDKDSYSRTSEYLFDPAAIKIKPKLNGRHDLPDIEWLITDIAANGQLEPVIIRSDGGIAVLSAGFSRWRAIVEINKRKLTPVPLKIRCSYFKGDEVDGFKVAIRENRFRNQTTPLDDAYNIAQLKRWGQTEEEIAELYQQEVKWIRSREKLVELAPEAKEALKAGRLKAPAAAKLARMSAAAQKEAVAGEGKVKLPKKPASKPTEKITTIKREIRHKTLLEIHTLLVEQEMWNAAARTKILKMIQELAAKCEPKVEAE